VKKKLQKKVEKLTFFRAVSRWMVITATNWAI